ncbi:MAG TPA: hypothetical protein VKU38_12360 [Ktedonobacteraceae bacterium]|nr:hypothetical protein [Ktedonobacteraceae bacterium]
MPRSERCCYCPAMSRKRATASPMHSLFLCEETIWPSNDHAAKLREQALREAIAPYLCVAELRRLAAHREDIQMALKLDFIHIRLQKRAFE